DAFRERPIAACFGLLVTDHVRRQLFLREQSAQPLLDQRPAESKNQSGRFDRPLYPERIPWKRKRGELATCTSWRFHFDAAAILAQREKPFDHQRVMEDSSRG